MFDPRSRHFDEKPAQYPDAIRVRAPRGLRDRVRRAAEAECLPVSELIRRVIGAYLDRVDPHDRAEAGAGND